MADIELVDFGDHREDQPPEDGREEEKTTFDDGWRDESLLEFDDNGPGGEIPNPKKGQGRGGKSVHGGQEEPPQIAEHQRQEG